MMLDRAVHGDPTAAREILPLVYEELRKLAAARLAREPAGQTLQATALVHEAWLRLGGGEDESHWQNRGHFFAAAAEAMRRIMVESARRKRTIRRGGGLARVDVDEIEIAAEQSGDELLAVHEALDLLAQHDTRKAELVKLRYFAGLTIEQAAEVLRITVPTANRDWAYARAWLFSEISRNRSH
jgi:RNA polymerase sigma factor (TIGR02999 family)